MLNQRLQGRQLSASLTVLNTNDEHAANVSENGEVVRSVNCAVLARDGDCACPGKSLADGLLLVSLTTRSGLSAGGWQLVSRAYRRTAQMLTGDISILYKCHFVARKKNNSYFLQLRAHLQGMIDFVLL